MNLLNEPWREQERRERREAVLRVVRFTVIGWAWFALGLALGMWICGK